MLIGSSLSRTSANRCVTARYTSFSLITPAIITLRLMKNSALIRPPSDFSGFWLYYRAPFQT